MLVYGSLLNHPGKWGESLLLRTSNPTACIQVTNESDLWERLATAFVYWWIPGIFTREEGPCFRTDDHGFGPLFPLYQPANHYDAGSGFLQDRNLPAILPCRLAVWQNSANHTNVVPPVTPPRYLGSHGELWSPGVQDRPLLRAAVQPECTAHSFVAARRHPLAGRGVGGLQTDNAAGEINNFSSPTFKSLPMWFPRVKTTALDLIIDGKFEAENLAKLCSHGAGAREQGRSMMWFPDPGRGKSMQNFKAGRPDLSDWLGRSVHVPANTSSIIWGSLSVYLLPSWLCAPQKTARGPCQNCGGGIPSTRFKM
ncbi:hypothetical protein B0H13DRAFT_1880581 [Mycena leptocephala]|nr:hypothetical protein B0H13DRAFT_1880581 [Mycena leptocephala]